MHSGLRNRLRGRCLRGRGCGHLDRRWRDLWLRRSENSWSALPDALRSEFSDELWPLIETNFKYEGHLGRQQSQIDRMARQEGKRLPETLDYEAIRGLKKEAQVRFSEIRPATIGQAGRIPGVTPADVHILWAHLRRR